MEVTDVKIRLKQSGKLKAIAMVTLDNALIINDITLFENRPGVRCPPFGGTET